MRFLLLVLVTGLLQACALTYDMLQNIQEEECRRDPTLECPKFESYEEYQRRRKPAEQLDVRFIKSLPVHGGDFSCNAIP